MSTKITLTQIFRKDVDTRFGVKPRVGVKTVEYGDKWLSTFKTKGTEDWVEGMVVEVDISEKGDFMNFNPIIKAGINTATQTAYATVIEARVKKLEDKVFGVAEVAKETVEAEPTLEDEFDTGF